LAGFLLATEEVDLMEASFTESQASHQKKRERPQRNLGLLTRIFEGLDSGAEMKLLIRETAKV